MAEAVFQNLTKPANKPHHSQVAKIDSAGTAAYHIGSDPDPRTMSTLRDNGINSYRHKARKFVPDDFMKFDYVFAMDSSNLEDLEMIRVKSINEGKDESKLAKLMVWGDFGGREKGEEVVDPYYGGKNGFDIAYEQMDRFTRGFLKYLENDEQ